MTFASAERAYLTPPEPHECDLPDCDGDECETAAREAWEADRDNRNDAIRKGEW